MTITFYGIPNCDTVKRARAWLADKGVVYVFHDVKKQGVTPELIDGWLGQIAWENLLNRAGITYKKLTDAQRAVIVDAATARDVMEVHPSTIKRPVVRWTDGALTVGFDAEVFGARVIAMRALPAPRI